MDAGGDTIPRSVPLGSSRSVGVFCSATSRYWKLARFPSRLNSSDCPCRVTYPTATAALYLPLYLNRWGAPCMGSLFHLWIRGDLRCCWAPSTCLVSLHKETRELVHVLCLLPSDPVKGDQIGLYQIEERTGEARATFPQPPPPCMHCPDYPPILESCFELESWCRDDQQWKLISDTEKMGLEAAGKNRVPARIRGLACELLHGFN